MDTTTVQITETDIVALLKGVTDKLAPQFPELEYVKAEAGPLSVTVHGYIKGTVHLELAQGDSFEAAAKALREKLGPISSYASLAAKKREQARRLLAEADQLSPITQNEKAPAL